MDRIVIVGAGHSAGQAVLSLKQKKFDGRLTLIGEESWYPYQRPPLSKKFLAGELPAERLFFKPQDFYDDPRITVLLGRKVTRIDRESSVVVTDDGREHAYDGLIIATGGRPRRLAIPGVDLAGIHYLRGIDDVNRIREDMSAGSRIAIIGAGYIGLEVAAVTRQLGMDVTVIEMEERVMSRVVSPELSTYYQNVHTAHGVRIMLSTGVVGFSGQQRVEGVMLGNGDTLETDLVVVGIGIAPNIELAEACGLDVGDGIVVDDHCRTNDPAVFAVGDCAWHPNALLGTSLRLESVHNAVEQAKTAAANICGEDVAYAQVPWFWSDQYDLKLQIAGVSRGYDEAVIRGDPAVNAFSCIYLRGGELIAVDAVNAPRDYIQCRSLIADHVRIDPARLADSTTQLKDMA